MHRDGGGPNCLVAQIVATVRRLAANRQIERKLLYENAKRLFRLPQPERSVSAWSTTTWRAKNPP